MSTFDIGKIFERIEPFSKISTKKEYEKYMNIFLSERYVYLKELVEAADVAVASNDFCDGVHEAFKKFGKVRMGDMMNLNYFIIYYIFPAILKNEGEKATAICDALRDAWNTRFKCNISYTDYDKLMSGFQNRILGMRIGDD